MDVRTEVTKKHFIEMDDEEARLLIDMLTQYRRQIGDRLPDGMPADQEYLIGSLRSMTGVGWQ